MLGLVPAVLPLMWIVARVVELALGPGEARETDIGLTGGGAGKHMVYLSGLTDHTIQDEGMIDHIVNLVEAKAAEIEAAKLEAETTDAGKAEAAE